MPTPGEHRTVQARILAYAEAIGWTFVPRDGAEQRRGFEPQIAQMGADAGARRHLGGVMIKASRILSAWAGA